jgi:hypothetical protein
MPVQTNRRSRANYDAIVSGNRCAINWIVSVIVILTHRNAAAGGLITPSASLFFFPLSSI